MKEKQWIDEARALLKRALRDAMYDLSERCWCAGWMDGLEYALWDIANKGGGVYGQGEIMKFEADRLLKLAEMVDGWMAWIGDEYDSDSPVFVPMDEWLQMVNTENSTP